MTALTGKATPEGGLQLPVRPSASRSVACCPSSDTQVSRATGPSVMSSTSMHRNVDAPTDASDHFRALPAQMTAAATVGETGFRQRLGASLREHVEERRR